MSPPPDQAAATVPLRILLVDDHPVVREALALRFAQEPDLSVCGSVGDAAGALRALDEAAPDLVILDLTLPDSQGLDLIKEIHARRPEVRILVFSMHDENLYGERALRAGAQGYLMKGEPPERVHEAVRRVFDGRLAVSDSLAQKLLANATRRRPATSAVIEHLSDREFEVFRWIGLGLGTKEIAERLHRSVKTIETYRQRLKDKLGVGSAPQLVARAATWIAEHERPGNSQ